MRAPAKNAARAEKGKKRYNNGMKTPLRRKTAQDQQDEIFKRMSADEKIRLGSQLWEMAKDLVGNKINYANNRSKTSVGRSS